MTINQHLYYPIDPYDHGYLDVGSLHKIYYEQSGNPEGLPIVFLHGGPGAGASPMHRRFFDPEIWRIIILDQRGCGRSVPHAEIRENSPEDLVADLEKVRALLGISKWHVFGGSWGSTLALFYAQTYPERVLGLILRGIFLMTPEEIEWFLYEMGQFRPEAWGEFVALLSREEQKDILEAYWRRLTDENDAIVASAARTWSRYESSCARLLLDQKLLQFADDGKQALSLALLECHYFRNNQFDPPDRLLRDIAKIRHIPTVIVQGRYDLICPPKTAYHLHKLWPEADYIMVEDAGHYALEEGILRELLKAIHRFRTITA